MSAETETQRTVRTQAELDQAIADGVDTIRIVAPDGVLITVGETRESHVVVSGGRVGWVDSGGRVEQVVSGGSVGWVGSGGSVGWVGSGGSVERVVSGGSVGWVGSGGSVERVGSGGSVERVGSGGSVGWVGSGGSVERVGSGGRVEQVGSGGSVGWVDSGGRVEQVGSGGRVERAAGAATIHLHGGSLTSAGSNVAVLVHHASSTWQGGHLIDLTELDLTDPVTWCAYHAVEVADGQATLYKAARSDLRSQRGALYQPGTTTSCEDWEDTPTCGGGLHLSPSPTEAGIYDSSATRYLECRVPVAELRPIPGGTAAKCKAPCIQVIREVDVHGAPVEQTAVAS